MSKDSLDVKRHSAAHILAAAVQDLFKDVKFGVGPVVENGFYYDIEFPSNISEENLPGIEKKMKEMIKKNLNFEKEEMSIKDAIEYFEKAKQNYKVELLKDLEKKGTTKLSDEELQEVGEAVDKVTVYKTGNFVDLCRGPHVDSSNKINPKAFKLTKLAGAYWRGDENNKMITRIYGVLFDTKDELNDYLELLEEAKMLDHRKLGKELDLFTFSDLVGKGLPLWTEKGATIRRELENFVIEEEIKRGYKHVVTPELAKVDLYRKSGHYPYYKDTMYPPMEIDDEELILRPMTCPHHFMLYSDKKRSYRELPMRIAELARLFRYEKSGELTGMLRVRSFCLADAHIVCMEEQAKEEIKQVIELIDYISGVLGLEKGKDYSYRLSLGDREDEKKYYKDDKAWDCAEKILRETLGEIKAPFEEAKGDAAFYGPKIDIQMKNVLGKEDTAFTIQYDFCMPERFEMTYVDKDGEEKRPIVIHRSSIGAIERTFAFLIEKYAGAFPLWLSPIQVHFVPVSEKHIVGTRELADRFKEAGIRIEIDEADETVGNKVRKAVGQKIPYIVVVGDDELSGGELKVRVRGRNDQIQTKRDEFIERLKKEIKEKK
ncbi:MAG: threonine--tRNA ligase [Candidatus Magasanikbacteria bacterium]|nr:threonine--tRNA ligase [Candidatus Magasanikbacteria bacterium]